VLTKQNKEMDDLEKDFQNITAKLKIEHGIVCSSSFCHGILFVLLLFVMVLFVLLFVMVLFVLLFVMVLFVLLLFVMVLFILLLFVMVLFVLLLFVMVLFVLLFGMVLKEEQTVP
jgi:hypothetical protein